MSLLFWGTANISCLKCWKCKIPAWLSHTCNWLLFIYNLHVAFCIIKIQHFSEDTKLFFLHHQNSKVLFFFCHLTSAKFPFPMQWIPRQPQSATFPVSSQDFSVVDIHSSLNAYALFSTSVPRTALQLFFIHSNTARVRCAWHRKQFCNPS